MVNDPKWRTIARKSNQRIGDVISVYMHMMTAASNATERGRTQGWSDEDVATALDIETSDVVSIREAMQGRVLEGDYLTGWEKRQPKREDDSSSRGKKWREDSKNNSESENQTQPNAGERKSVVDTEEIRGDKEKNIEPLSSKHDLVAVLQHLNEKANRDFQPVAANLKLIQSRLKEGATVETCKKVIDSKVAEWLNDKKMVEYLRPATLFNATNFAQYVGQLPKNEQTKREWKEGERNGDLIYEKWIGWRKLTRIELIAEQKAKELAGENNAGN
jgi:uncharacterized phage protein (TIGR02220 family)